MDNYLFSQVVEGCLHPYFLFQIKFGWFDMQIIKTKNRSEIWNYLRDADYDVRALLTGQIIELKVHL